MCVRVVQTKYVVYGGVGSTLLFIAISIIMTVVYGSKKGHPGYYVLALAMLGLLISVLVLVRPVCFCTVCWIVYVVLTLVCVLWWFVYGGGGGGGWGAGM